MTTTTKMTTEQFNEKVQLMLAEIQEMNMATSQALERIEANVYA